MLMARSARLETRCQTRTSTPVAGCDWASVVSVDASKSVTATTSAASSHRLTGSFPVRRHEPCALGMRWTLAPAAGIYPVPSPRQGAGDGATAEDFVATVEGDGLAGGEGALAALEAHGSGGGLTVEKRRGGGLRLVARLRLDGLARRGRGARHPRRHPRLRRGRRRGRPLRPRPRRW